MKDEAKSGSSFILPDSPLAPHLPTITADLSHPNRVSKEGPMQTRKQVTVFLENKPGRLAQVLSALAHGKINIVALSVMDRHEHGVLRLVTEDEAATAKTLQTINAHFTESDVLVIELKNQPGALANLCERL